MTIRLAFRLMTAFALGVAATLAIQNLPAAAQDNCPSRGQLDTLYCDADGDLVADVPIDPAKLKDPATLIFAYSAVEAPQVYQKMFQPLLDALGQCTGKKVVYYPANSATALIEAMRSGRLHIADFSTGAVGFAVNMAGAVPIVSFANEKGIFGYKVVAIVRADSPYKALADLKGKKIAHVAPSSNSGNLAPRVFFPSHGLVPETDYKPLMSGGHDKSVLGVLRGDFDMAPVASDILERMIARGDVKATDVRVIYESQLFPTASFSIAHDLKPELAAAIRICMLAFRMPEAMSRELNGVDRFTPIAYKETWAPIRDVAERSGTPYNKAAYEARAKREAEAEAKKAAEAPPTTPGAPPASGATQPPKQ
jgi:phosphonate transport system substrate-binding protein